MLIHLLWYRGEEKPTRSFGAVNEKKWMAGRSDLKTSTCTEKTFLNKILAPFFIYLFIPTVIIS